MKMIVCSKSEALKKIRDINEDDVVLILTVMNVRKKLHWKPRKINKKKGERLIKKSDRILYQDNDFFGVLSLYGVNEKEKDIINNILFPQKELE